MAQHDYSIANQSGASFRADLNNALSAIVSLNSGAAEPSTTFAYQLWADTTAGLLKIRNAANSAWITLRELDGTLLVENGSAASPALAFASDLNTGVYRADADILGFATGGVGRAFLDASGRLLVGTGTANGDALLQVNGGYNILKGFSRRPPLHRGPLFTKTAATTLSVVANCSLNGFFYSAATAVTMPSHSNNTDYAIWQHPTTGALVGSSSFTTAPTGAESGSIVGGYHYIPSGRPTAVNNGSATGSAEILEYSIWDLTWRPECPDPRGMSCIDGRFWIDMYLCGKTSYAGTDFSAVPSSKIGLTIADYDDPPLVPAFYGGNGSTAYADVSTDLYRACWYDFCEVASSFGKRLPSMAEFQNAAFGAPEGGSKGSDPGTVTWERASKWGLAQATGVMWHWGADLMFRDVNSQTFDWRTSKTRSRGDVYQQGSADSLTAVFLGGDWGVGSYSGSRASSWNVPPWNSGYSVGARFAAGHLVLG